MAPQRPGRREVSVSSVVCNPGLSVGGWVFLVAAWTVILLLNVFCFSKILRNERRKR